MSQEEEKRGSKRKRPESESPEDEVEEVGGEEDVSPITPPINASHPASPPTADTVGASCSMQQELLELTGKNDHLLVNLHELLKSTGNDQFDMMHYQQQLCTAPALVPTMADFGAITAAIAAMPGAVAAAVAAVVPGAVAVAVAPLTAQVTMLAAQVTNIPIRAYNQRQNTMAQANGMPGPCRQPLKVQAGNGAGLPAGGPAVLAVAAAVAAAPVAVGAVPLAGVFPADDTAIDTMSHADLQILSVIYNETFHIIAIDNLGQRRRKFRSWLCD